jgi:glycosyltransferase involved in cell wall biosynthesis
MTPTPLVSVVIPAYNAERFLQEAIDSVLGQTWSNLELIVVDDGSTDGTGAIIERQHDPRVRGLSKENRRTVADARNAGIAAARGELIALLDADDVWLPTKLERQVALLEARPEVGLAYCGYAITDERLALRTVIWPSEHDPRFRRWLLLEGNGTAPSSTSLIRRSVLDQVGGYRLELSVSEDLDLSERIAGQFTVAAVDECLAAYRSHGGQGHARLDRFEHDMTWILADRFGPDGDRDRGSWRRGTANLHTRLFTYRLIAGERGAALRHLVTVLRTGPARLVALPVEAVVRRSRRRRRLTRERAGINLPGAPS